MLLIKDEHLHIFRLHTAEYVVFVSKVPTNYTSFIVEALKLELIYTASNTDYQLLVSKILNTRSEVYSGDTYINDLDYLLMNPTCYFICAPDCKKSNIWAYIKASRGSGR